MTPESPADRWAEVDAIFRRVLEVPATDRVALLTEATQGDESLQRSVETLLAHAEDWDGLLETPVEMACDLGWEDLVDSLDSGESSAGPAEMHDRSGERVGPYRLLRQVGRGGMATVYLAERADGQWEQQVAVKVIRRGLDTDDVIRRFLAERQILSSLQHPNIARLLDGGSTEDGLPYLVLEFVEGEPITTHCDARRLRVRERLELFCDVCRAVQFAHQGLVVHRDLKPSNILVTADGHVTLLDFGIAKLLDGSAEHATRTGRQRLTPQYASPELVRGDPITTVSDVYQLGVLLCSLLSGQRPYDVTSLSPARLEAKITGSEPERPSRLVSDEAARARGLTADRLVRRLRGDLDAIVLKALRKAPADRYPSAESLVADVRRHLSGHPVEATRGAVTYRAGKFVRRHVAGLVTTAAFAVLLSGGTAALAVQRNRAVAAADTAEQVASFLASVYEDADPVTGVGDTMSVRTQLAQGARRVDTELAGQPALQARLFGVIGSAYQNLGRLDEGIEILDAALGKAREAYGPADEELAAAILDLADALSTAREFDRTVPLYEEYVALQRARLGPNAVEVAEGLSSLAVRIRDVVGPDSAEVLLRQARTVAERFPGSEIDTRISLSLAYVLRAKGEFEEAEALYREAIRSLRVTNPNDPQLATHLNNLAFLLKEREAYEEAVVLYREALSRYSDVHGPGHPVSLMLASNLGNALFLGQRIDEGEAVMNDRVAAAREQWPEGHWRVAVALQSRAISRARFGNGVAAAEGFREAVEAFARTQGDRHSWTATARAWLGATLLAVEADPAGDRELDRALADLEAYGREDTIEDRSVLLGMVADYLEEQGLAERAGRVRAVLPD
ncbi:MAG: protein kinase [Gemmatimonadota bacterium]